MSDGDGWGRLGMVGDGGTINQVEFRFRDLLEEWSVQGQPYSEEPCGSYEVVVCEAHTLLHRGGHAWGSC